ncbi:MAG: hypothetical protein AAGF95_27965 [Chloroflexota bacterium]
MTDSSSASSPLVTWDASGTEIILQASAGTGILRITDNCVFLERSNQRTTLLIWPEPTSWNEETQSITFVDLSGEQLELRDGDRITPGGYSLREGFSFVVPPHPDCHTDFRFVVTAMTKEPS